MDVGSIHFSGEHLRIMSEDGRIDLATWSWEVMGQISMSHDFGTISSTFSS